MQARRRPLHCAFGSIPWARMLQALGSMMLFNPRKILFIVSGFPATAVWFAWYFEQWSLMVTCLLLAVPIMICDAAINRGPRARTYEIAILLLFYLPLVLYSFARLYQTG